MRRNNQGSILLLTLAFLGLLAANALFFSRYVYRLSNEWNTHLYRYKALCAAKTGALAGLEILQDDTNTTDYLGESWATEKRIVLPDGPVTITISDMESRFNLNRMMGKEGKSDEKAITLFRNLLLSLSAKSELTDSLLDWLDEDDFPRVFGAEREYYRSLSPGYIPANSALTSLDQLFLIKGFTPQLLRGASETVGLLDLVTTVSEGTININTAHPLLLKAMGFSEGAIESIVTERTFRPLDEAILLRLAKEVALSWKSHITYKSHWFRITAIAENLGTKSTVSLLVKREGAKVRIVRWEYGAISYKPLSGDEVKEE